MTAYKVAAVYKTLAPARKLAGGRSVYKTLAPARKLAGGADAKIFRRVG